MSPEKVTIKKYDSWVMVTHGKAPLVETITNYKDMAVGGIGYPKRHAREIKKL